MAALPQHFKSEDSISMLVKSGKTLVENGVDYRQVHLSCTIYMHVHASTCHIMCMHVWH